MDRPGAGGIAGILRSAQAGANIEVYPGYEPDAGGWDGYLFNGAAIPDTETVEVALKLDPSKRAGDNDQFLVRSTPHEYPNNNFSVWHISYTRSASTSRSSRIRRANAQPFRNGAMPAASRWRSSRRC